MTPTQASENLQIKKDHSKKITKSKPNDKDIYKDGPKRHRSKPIKKDRYKPDYNDGDDTDDNNNSESYY